MNDNQKIYEALNKVMADIGTVAKNQKASMGAGGTYQFRGIDDAMAAAQPALVKHGVMVIPKALDMNVRDVTIGKYNIPGVRVVLTVQHTFYALDGSSVDCVTVGEAMDTGDKACNKAMSAAFKYAIFESLCVPTKEQAEADPDHDNPALGDAAPPEEPLSEEPPQDIFQTDQYKTLLAKWKKLQPKGTVSMFKEWASDVTKTDMTKKANWDLQAISIFLYCLLSE